MCGCVSAATARASRANRVHLLVEGDGTRQHLDRDTTVQTGVGGAEHFAHATRTDRALDAKRSKEAAGRQFEPVAKQTICEGPDRPIENDRGIVLPQQRFDLAAERLVSGTRLGEKDVASSRILLGGQLVDLGDTLPAIGRHSSLRLMREERSRAVHGLLRDATDGRLPARARRNKSGGRPCRERRPLSLE